MNSKKERLIEIAADGKISNDEIDDFIHIRQELERISLTVETLSLIHISTLVGRPALWPPQGGRFFL